MNLYFQIRSFLLYRPNDPFNLWQQPPQRVTPGNVERIKGYRYPAPGSRPGAAVPTRFSEDEVYDIKHYARDPRNLIKDVSHHFSISYNFTRYFFIGKYSDQFLEKSYSPTGQRSS